MCPGHFTTISFFLYLTRDDDENDSYIIASSTVPAKEKYVAIVYVTRKWPPDDKVWVHLTFCHSIHPSYFCGCPSSSPEIQLQSTQALKVLPNDRANIHSAKHLSDQFYASSQTFLDRSMADFDKNDLSTLGTIRWYGLVQHNDIEEAKRESYIYLNVSPCYEMDANDKRGPSWIGTSGKELEDFLGRRR